MTLLDEARMRMLYAGMGPALEMSGGSCANTMAALASLGARVTVLLHRAPDRLEVEVANGPAPAATGAPAPRSGFGLTGLRERVVLAGGDLTAGVCPDGGWRLRAIVPTDTPAGAEEAAP
jgi:signal transduction histidine kinase